MSNPSRAIEPNGIKQGRLDVFRTVDSLRKQDPKKMHISSASIIATLAFLSPLTAAANVELEARDNVAACKAILIALKASQFCSSFVPIKDVTSTETKTGPTGYTKVTVTAACTNPYKKEKRAPSTTPAAPSTTTPSTTPGVTTTSSTTSRVYTTTTASKCTIKGVQPQVASFGCSVIKEACTAFVKPKTIKASTSSLIHYVYLTINSPLVQYLKSHYADHLQLGLHLCSWDNSYGYTDGHADV